jgi:hypothetical protein
MLKKFVWYKRKREHTNMGAVADSSQMGRLNGLIFQCSWLKKGGCLHSVKFRRLKNAT